MDSTASSRSRNEATAEKFGVKAHNPGESGGSKKAGSVQPEVKDESSSAPPPPKTKESTSTPPSAKKPSYMDSTASSRSRNAETNEAHKDKFEKRGVDSHHTGEDKMGTLSKDKAAAASAGAGTKAGSSSTAKGPTASSTKPAATKSSATSSKPTAPTSNAKAGGTPPPSGGKAASGGKARVGVADATTKATEAGKRDKAPVSPPKKPAPKPIKL